MITPECTYGVTRHGEFQPCDKPAVARSWDAESGEAWSVCAYHARRDATPMEDWLPAELRKAKVEALREAAGRITGDREAVEWLRDRADRIEAGDE